MTPTLLDRLRAAGFTRLDTDYIGAPKPNEGEWREGWRIHDFPAEPNPQGMWFAHFIADGLEEDEAQAIVACVNHCLALLSTQEPK